jgi:hypothetical protein
VRAIATGCHAGVDAPLTPGEGAVEDIESATDIVLEGDADAFVYVLAVA